MRGRVVGDSPIIGVTVGLPASERAAPVVLYCANCQARRYDFTCAKRRTEYMQFATSDLRVTVCSEDIGLNRGVHM